MSMSTVSYQIAKITKDFSDFKEGDQVGVLDESSLAFKVRSPADPALEAEKIMFVPKHSIELIGNAVASIGTKSTAEYGMPPSIIPPPLEPEPEPKPQVQPGIEFSKAEESILDALMGAENTEVIIGASTFDTVEEDTDSGVKGSTWVPPESAEVRAQKVVDAALAKTRGKLKIHAEPKLTEGQFWLTDLTEGQRPASRVDHIVTAYAMDDWPEQAQKDIPDVHIEYSWNPDVLEAVIMAHQLDQKVLITGLPGTGKTSAINQFAAHIRQPYMRFNGKDGIEQSSFLGYPWATEEGMVWKDGILPLGLKAGYIICLDEVFKIPAGIQMAMQNLYEKGGRLMLDDKPGEYHEKLVTPHPEARLMLTDNVKGTGDDFEKFASTQIQDSSTLDRFDITIELPYMTPKAESKMLSNMFPVIAPKVIDKLTQFASLVRSGYKQGEIALTLSPRGLISTLEMHTKTGIPVDVALDYAYTNKIAEDTELQAIAQMKSTVGGW